MLRNYLGNNTMEWVSVIPVQIVSDVSWNVWEPVLTGRRTE